MKEHEKQPTIKSQEDLEAYIEVTHSASLPVLDAEEDQIPEEVVAPDEPPSLEEEAPEEGAPEEESLEGMIKERRLRVLSLVQEIYEMELERQRLWDDFTEKRINRRLEQSENWQKSINALEQRKRTRDGQGHFN